MFNWFKTRRDGGNAAGKGSKARRAYRPECDRLEKREVPAIISVIGGSSPRFALGMTLTPPSNGFSNVNATGFPNFNAPAAVTNGLKTATPSNNALLTTAARAATLLAQAGRSSNVNTTLLNGGRAGSSVFPASNSLLNSVSGVTSGLAFTNPQGLFNPANGLTVGNSAQNGLAFTNLQGLFNPANGLRTGNSAQNGLAFTNVQGLFNPANGLTVGNSAQNGLAFTNLQGLFNPANGLTVGNSAQNGLAFTNTGFNPGTFLNGATNGLAFTGNRGF